LLTPPLLSRGRALTDDFHQHQHSAAEHRTRSVCLGIPLATCTLPVGVCYLLTYLLALVVLKVRHTGRGAGRRYHSTPRRPARSRSPSRDVGRSARRGELRTRPRDHADYALRNRIVLDYRIVGFRGVKVTSGCSLPSTYGVRSLRRHVPLSSSRENHHRQKAQEQGQKGDDAPKRPVTALGVFDHGAHLLLQRLHV